MRTTTLSTLVLLGAVAVSDCTCGDSLALAIGEIELALCDRGEACGCEILAPATAQIDFGSPEVGTTSRRVLELRNLNQPRKLTVQTLTIVGGDLFSVARVLRYDSREPDAEVETHDFADGPLELDNEAWAEVYLAYEPTSATEITSTLEIVSTSAANPTWSIPLRAGGGSFTACVPSGACGDGSAIDYGTFDDSELGFDNASGLPRALGTQQVLVTNESEYELYFSVAITQDGIPEGPGEQPGERGVFFLADPGCTVVPPFGSATVSIEYRPSSAGEHLGEALVKGLGAPIHIALRGRVIGAHICFRTEDVQPNDTLLQFGDPPLNQTALNVTPNETRRIWLGNCGFEEDLVVSAAQLHAETAPAFSSTALPWSQTGPIAPGAEIEMPVALTPTSGLGAILSGRVLFTTNDRRFPTAFVTLAGRIGPPQVCVLAAIPTPVDFGWVASDEAQEGAVCIPGLPCTGAKVSRRKSMTLTNLGQRTCNAVTLGAITPMTATADMFKYDGPPPAAFTLAPGASSAPIDLLFVDDPKETPEIFTASLAFTSPDNTGPSAVLLTVKSGGSPACALDFVPVSPPSLFCPQEAVAFGNVNYGQSKTIPLQVRNIGSEACEVTNVRRQTGTSSAFAFPTTPFNIPVGQAHILEITFTAPVPTGDPFEEFPFLCGGNGAMMDYRSVSTNTATAQVAFTGMGKPPSIDVIPGEIDFGDVTVGCCSARQRVAVYNNGSTTLTLSSVSVVGANSDFSTTPPSRTSIPSGQSAELFVQFCASAEGPAADAVDIRGQDGNGNDEYYSVSMTGTGVLSSQADDRFQQPSRPMVDVLFVVDDSGSMGDEQDELATNFQSFIDGVLDLNTDYHIGVTNTDAETEWSGRLHSCYANKFITDLQPPAEQRTQFRCNVKVSDPADNRPSTDSKEAPLQAARAAFEYPTAEWNTGFYREEAKLYIIAVQDEAEQSDGEAALYVDYFRNLKGLGNPDLLNISAIAGPPPDGCTTAEGNQKLYDVTQAVGGQFRSICTADWSDMLNALGLDVFNARRQFPLSRPATAATLEVRVCPSGCPANPLTCPLVPQNATNGWTFDASVNAVTFNGSAVPGAGACIAITYIAVCYSEGQG